MRNPVSLIVNQKKKVFTRINTSFEEWKQLCAEEFIKRGFEPVDPGHLRMLHAWEGGDTPYGWVDFLNRQRILIERNIRVRRDNPENH